MSLRVPDNSRPYPVITYDPDKLAILGASLGNERITHELVTEARKQLNAAGIHEIRYMVTGDLLRGDGPSKWNFKALQLKPGSIRHNIRNLTRRLHAILFAAGAKPSEFIDWYSVYRSYKTQRLFLHNLMKNNTAFKSDIEKISAFYLEKKLKMNPLLDRVTEKMISLAANYPLEELALMLASPEIFKKSWVCYLYYEPWPVYEKLISGVYDGIKRDNLGMFIVKIENADNKK